MLKMTISVKSYIYLQAHNQRNTDGYDFYDGTDLMHLGILNIMLV